MGRHFSLFVPLSPSQPESRANEGILYHQLYRHNRRISASETARAEQWQLPAEDCHAAKLLARFPHHNNRAMHLKDSPKDCRAVDHFVRPPSCNRTAKSSNDSPSPSREQHCLGDFTWLKPPRGISTVYLCPGYRWSKNSCWLDASLELVFQAVMRNFQDFATRFSELPKTSSIQPLFQALNSRRRDHLNTDMDSDERSRQLRKQRNELRASLKSLGVIDSLDSFQSLFGWLGEITTRVDEASLFARTYFLGYTVKLRACRSVRGRDLSDSMHYQVTERPQRLFYLQLDSTMHAQYGGQLQGWFSNLLSVDPPSVPLHSCWWTNEGRTQCPGKACDVTIHVLLPIVLLIDAGSQHDIYWDVPKVLKQEESRTGQAGAVYELVGRALYSSISKHFVARFITPEGTVYTHDGMVANGFSRQENGELDGLIYGSSPLCPSGYRTQVAVYHLCGGAASQKQFYERQASEMERLHGLHLPSRRLDKHPFVTLHLRDFEKLSDHERTWMRNPSNHKTADYVKTCAGTTRIGAIATHNQNPLQIGSVALE